MSLKDRLKVEKNTEKKQKTVSLKKFKPDILLEKYLENSGNLVICCPLDISTGTGISFVAEKLGNTNRVVLIGENIFLKRNEIIKFEPEKNGVSKELIKTSLDLKADKILLQNFIGTEAMDIFNLINSGIKNIITCVNANNANNALRQIELNLYLSRVTISENLIKKMLCDFIDKIIVLKNIGDDIYVDKICEIKSLKNNDFVLSEIIDTKEITSNEFDGFNKETINKNIEDVLNEEVEIIEKPQKAKNILAKKIKRNKLNI